VTSIILQALVRGAGEGDPGYPRARGGGDGGHAADSDAVRAAAPGQGMTLVHFSAQRKHILWDMLDA